MQLAAMIAANTIVGVLRGKRLKYVQLLVPPDVAFRVLGEGVQRPRTGGGAQQWKFTYGEQVATGRLTILKRYNQRTNSFVHWGGDGFNPCRWNPDAIPEPLRRY